MDSAIYLLKLHDTAGGLGNTQPLLCHARQASALLLACGVPT